jgi:hypothetical protein
MPYDLYPAIDENYAFPPEVRVALSKSSELRNTIVPMTEAYRNSLPQSEKWDGRVIANLTSARLEAYSNALVGWYPLAYLQDVTNAPQMKMQSGIGQTNASGSATITFPTPFALTPACVVCAMGGVDFMFVSSITASSCIVGARTHDNLPASTYFSWIAMPSMQGLMADE